VFFIASARILGRTEEGALDVLEDFSGEHGKR